MNSSLCSFVKSLTVPSVSCPNIFFSTVFLNTLSLYSSLRLNTANVKSLLDLDHALTIQLYSRICEHISLECDKFSVKCAENNKNDRVPSPSRSVCVSNV